MRLDVHVFHHFDVVHLDSGAAKVLEAISNLKDLTMAVSAKLQASMDAANAGVAQANNKLEAMAAALAGSASVAAAAVATALAAQGIEEDAAADAINTARNAVQDHIDKVFATIGVPQPVPVPPLPDTTSGGQGSDTVAGPEALTLVTTALPDAITGQGYTASLEITGGAAPYTVNASPSSDNGVSIDGAGAVSGTTTADGDSTFAISVSDASDPVQTAGGTITLHSAAAAPLVENQ